MQCQASRESTEMGHVQSGHGQGSRLIIQSNHDKAVLLISFEFFFFDF